MRTIPTLNDSFYDDILFDGADPTQVSSVTSYDPQAFVGPPDSLFQSADPGQPVGSSPGFWESLFSPSNASKLGSGVVDILTSEGRKAAGLPPLPANRLPARNTGLSIGGLSLTSPLVLLGLGIGAYLLLKKR